MRPRKKILLYTRDEIFAGELQFMLETRGAYRVTHVASVPDVLVCCACYDLVMAEMLSSAKALAREVKKIRADLPVLAFSRFTNAYPLPNWSDCFIPEALCNSENILQCLAVLVQRKRGPKPARRAA